MSAETVDVIISELTPKQLEMRDEARALLPGLHARIDEIRGQIEKLLDEVHAIENDNAELFDTANDAVRLGYNGNYYVMKRGQKLRLTKELFALLKHGANNPKARFPYDVEVVSDDD